MLARAQLGSVIASTLTPKAESLRISNDFGFIDNPVNNGCHRINSVVSPGIGRDSFN